MTKVLKVFLRLKAWQLFILSCPLFLIPSNNVVLQACYLLGIAIYVGWIFSIGYVMYSFVRKPSRTRFICFEISCLVIIAIIIASFFISLDVTGYLSWILATLGIIASFNSYMFAARMLESVKQREMVNRSDSLWTFIYKWVFPIGVWFLQPSINTIIVEKQSILVEETQAM